jgi:hypothetical protein
VSVQFVSSDEVYLYLESVVSVGFVILRLQDLITTMKFSVERQSILLWANFDIDQ